MQHTKQRTGIGKAKRNERVKIATKATAANYKRECREAKDDVTNNKKGKN